jgi:glucans biosynthesis protein
VVERAKKLAAEPYRKPENNLPEALRNLKYDQYRDIRFNPARAFWLDAKLPFVLQFFHQGRHFSEPVRLNEITAKGAQEIRFDPASFDYGANTLDPASWKGLGFAGFRAHYFLNNNRYRDELIAFLGASYFRALGRDQVYGASARGLAVDTALASGEEFPRFVEFWVERPAENARTLTMYALMDSPRLSGAYRFVVRPGDETAIDVKLRLFLRENVSKLGVAPITSMFFFGENQPAPREDFRPEVHDSDGLAIQSGAGEWIWRPLSNPKRLLVTSFNLTNPAGFGLLQRDRRFANYEDLEARYDLRPSVWVEPRGAWGPGRVELVQIPTPDETNDNIVAYWVPENGPKPQQPFDLEYRLYWQRYTERKPPSAWVAQTRRGFGHVDAGVSLSKDKPGVVFTVDFDGAAVRNLGDDDAVGADVWVDANGKLMESRTERNAASGGLRLVLRVRRVDETKPVEMRAFVKAGKNQVVSETWSFVLPPE